MPFPQLGLPGAQFAHLRCVPSFALWVPHGAPSAPSTSHWRMDHPTCSAPPEQLFTPYYPNKRKRERTLTAAEISTGKATGSLLPPEHWPCLSLSVSHCQPGCGHPGWCPRVQPGWPATGTALRGAAVAEQLLEGCLAMPAMILITYFIAQI